MQIKLTYQEPCTQALKLQPAQLRPIYAALIDRCLQFPFSTVVTLESGEIIALLLNSIWRRDDVGGEGADYDTEGDNESENLTKFIEMLNACHEDFWKLAPPDVTAVLHREISSVSRKWQRQGIATKMVTAHLTKERIDEFGVGGVISETSSFANQALLLKQGFKCLKKILYSSIVDSQGNQIVKTADGSQELRLNLKLIEHFNIAA
ncbi:unnamed protein product [Caenorhabditis sp. 36 PRJEB53466]|nr:unnamed protein product [Caenorhabditis sp. 36 PRJEB53466]